YRARQGPGRARGHVPPRAAQLAAARGDLHRLVGRPPARRRRHHGDHLRRARHGPGPRAGGLLPRLPHRPGDHLSHGAHLPRRQPRRGRPLRLARSPDPLRMRPRAVAASAVAPAWNRPAAVRARLTTLAAIIRRQPLGAVGAVIVFALVVVALLAPLLAPHGPKETGFAPYLPP